jgi:hypothetical protein
LPRREGGLTRKVRRRPRDETLWSFDVTEWAWPPALAHLCGGGGIADIPVGVDETDLAVAPFEPHYVARLRIGAVFEHRDHFPIFEPGRGERYAIDLGVEGEEQTDIRTAVARRVQRLTELEVVGSDRRRSQSRDTGARRRPRVLPYYFAGGVQA